MRVTSEHSWFKQWGKQMYRFRYTVLIIWLVIFIGLAGFASQAQSVFKDNGFTPEGSDSDRGLVVITDKFNTENVYMQLVYQSDKLDLTLEENKKKIIDSLQPLLEKEVAGEPRWTEAKRITEDKSVTSLQVPLDLTTDESLDQYPKLRKLVEAPEEMKVYSTGGTAVLSDLSEASKRDALRAEIIGLPIALIVLIFVFGTLFASLLPLIVGLVSMTTTLGIFYFVAEAGVSLSTYLPNIVTMLGLAVGIDYALFLVSRFREELKIQATIEAAVAQTAHTAGKSIFFSGLAVLVGLFGMLFIPLNFFQSLCLGGALVVTLSVVVGNTLLLSLLGIFGHKINKFHLLPMRLRSENRQGGIWRKIAYTVMRRPFILSVLIVALLVTLLAPLFGVKFGVPGAEVLPPKYESRYGQDLLYKTFDQREIEPLLITVETKKVVTDPTSIQLIRDYVSELEDMSGVLRVRSYLDAVANVPDVKQASAVLSSEQVKSQLIQAGSAKDNLAVLEIVSQYKPKSDAVDQLVDKLRNKEHEGLTTHVTGSEPFRIDMISFIVNGIPWVLTFVLGVTFIILLFAFRSVVLPLKAVIMNVLSLGASLGVVVSVFQNGHFAELLNVTSSGYVNATTPVLIFCVVFGISMDYEVFLISRIIENYEQTGDNSLSTAEGLRHTGGLITSAAFILIVVVGTFMFTDIEIMKSLGMGLSLAVLLDATVIRIGLVPALMKLLGPANWWAPKWLGPIQPRFVKNED
jgi:RND superfamily putative drug exporter